MPPPSTYPHLIPLIDPHTASQNRKALTIGVGLVLFQQLSGQPSVLYYANRIFESAGLGFQAAVGVGVFKLIMTLVSVRLVEDPRWGRRPLLLYGTAGMTLSLFALSALFALGGAAGPSQGLVIACVVAFVGCYQVGRAALEERRPLMGSQKRFGRRLEEVAKAVGGGCCRLQKLALAVRQTASGL